MKTSPPPSLTLNDVLAAQTRIAGGIRRTQCHRLPDRPEYGGREIWLKREDLQRTRSFKERGALNALLSLSPEQRALGVIAASAGNHAAGLAFHGARLGVKVTVVMPTGASEIKVRRCRSLNAHVVLHGNSYEDSAALAEEFAARQGQALVHPFDDLAVIAGQGTVGLEIAAAVPHFDAVVVPVGGGGLVAGLGTALKALRPDATLIAVRPGGGRVPECRAQPTLADGLAVSQPGALTMAIAAPLIDAALRVSEAEIAAAMQWLARSGITAEGAGAAAFAAVLGGHVDARRIVVVVTGGNVDPKLHERVMQPDAAQERRACRAA